MNEFGPKNNAPGLENECRQIQSNSHVYICTGRFLELDLKIPELYCSRLEVGNKRRIRFDSSTTLAVAGAVTASLAFFFFGLFVAGLILRYGF